MSRRHDALDGRPGSIPDIRTDVRGLTFVMRPLGTRSNDRLVIRCDDAGDVWVAIRSDVRSDD
jgi:hypothetical protein